MKVQVLSPAPFELGRAPESGALFVVGKDGFVDERRAPSPASFVRVWYNSKRTVPRIPGRHLFRSKPGLA